MDERKFTVFKCNLCIRSIHNKIYIYMFCHLPKNFNNDKKLGEFDLFL